MYGAVAKALGTDKLPGTDTIDGKKVEIIIRDNLGTGPGAAAATRQLIDSDKVNAIIGPLYTTEALSALPLIEKAGILSFSLTGCPDCGDGTQVPDLVLGRGRPPVADAVDDQAHAGGRRENGGDAAVG